MDHQHFQTRLLLSAQVWKACTSQTFTWLCANVGSVGQKSKPLVNGNGIQVLKLKIGGLVSGLKAPCCRLNNG
uniref:Uncharacterized protein n=1 Tax=Rhizophora mucronata TaxID=61149 RepID=A0A2P2JFJ7_RHIMU